MTRHLLFVLALFTFVSASSAEMTRFDHFARESTGTFTSNTFGRHLSGTATVHLVSHTDTLQVTIIARATSGETWRTVSVYRGGELGAFHHTIPFHSSSVYAHLKYHTHSSGLSAHLQGDVEASFRLHLGGNILRLDLQGTDSHNRPFRFDYHEH